MAQVVFMWDTIVESQGAGVGPVQHIVAGTVGELVSERLQQGGDGKRYVQGKVKVKGFDLPPTFEADRDEGDLTVLVSSAQYKRA